MNVSGLTSSTTSSVRRHSRLQRLGRRRLERQPVPRAPADRRPRTRRCAASRGTCAPGLPRPATELHVTGCLLLLLVFRLLDLALLDDFGLGRRRRRRRRGGIGRRRLGFDLRRTTWTMSMSASLTAFHLPPVGRSRTRTPSCSISSVTSTVMCSGMSAGRHSSTSSRCTKSTTPPCGLDALGFAGQVHRHGDAQDLVHRDAIEVRVQQLVLDRVQLVFLDEHARVAGAVELQRDQRVDAGLRVQDAAAAPSDRPRATRPARWPRRRARRESGPRGAGGRLRSCRTVRDGRLQVWLP